MAQLNVLDDFSSLYEKEYTRDEVAKELNISVRTLYRYLDFGSDYIPVLQTYFDEHGFPNRKRFQAHHLEFIREVSDLLKSFSKDRVIQILTRKYSQSIGE